MAGHCLDTRLAPRETIQDAIATQIRCTALYRHIIQVPPSQTADWQPNLFQSLLGNVDRRWFRRILVIASTACTASDHQTLKVANLVSVPRRACPALLIICQTR